LKEKHEKNHIGKKADEALRHQAGWQGSKAASRRRNWGTCDWKGRFQQVSEGLEVTPRSLTITESEVTEVCMPSNNIVISLNEKKYFLFPFQ
jgi:hypothetical protein